MTINQSIKIIIKEFELRGYTTKYITKNIIKLVLNETEKWTDEYRKPSNFDMAISKFYCSMQS